MIIKIADVFGVTADQLMRDELELEGWIAPKQKASNAKKVGRFLFEA